MRSLRLGISEAISRWLFKRPLARSTDTLAFRRLLARFRRFVFEDPPFMARRKRPLGHSDALWVSAGPVARDLLVFYIHGGGFIAGAPETHDHLAAAVCARLRAEAVLPRYRLAPEHPFPAGHDDVIAAWEDLIAQGHDPSRIVVMGDSAGGCLMFALLAHISRTGSPLPLAAVALSPVVDLTYKGASWQENSGSDAVLVASRRDDLHGAYLGTTPADDPRASPLFASFERCPPVLFHVGDQEVLRDDTHAMAAHLRANGAEVLVRSWPTGLHAWHLSHHLLPEAQEALDDIAAFINRQAVKEPMTSADS